MFVPTFRTDECLEEIRDCLERGWTGLGFKTLEIERAWCDYTGLPQAHFLNSGTAALHVALQILKDDLGWVDGDEVISTALTFVSTNQAIKYVGMRPVFADVDQYLCLDPDSVSERMTERTRAVVFVGMGGSTGQLPRVAELCRERGIALVLDAAHMAGTLLDGQAPGRLADVSCYSFQAVKNLPTADSGMVCFASSELDARARRFSWVGVDKDTYARWHTGVYSWRYDVEMVGYKYHGNSVMAALALVALRHLDEDNARRRHLAALYESRLRTLPEVDLIEVPQDCVPSRHLFQLRTPARDALIGFLQHRGIFPGVHYRSNSEYGPFRDQLGLCPAAERASAELMSVPLHLRLSDEDVHRVCDAVTEFFEVKAPALP